MLNLNFRPLCENDVLEIAELYIQTYQAPPWNETYLSTDPIQQFIESHLSNNYFLGYVGLFEGSIVAVSIGFKKPWPQGMEYYIDEFFVDYKMQYKGIGKSFMKYIEKDVKDNGLNAIILNTEQGYPSEKFYIKNGYARHQGLTILSKSIE